MPRISELPQIQTIGLHGNELLPIVDSGVTSRTSVMDIRYEPLSHGSSSLYNLTLLSYQPDGYTSLAGIKLYQNGVEIPPSAIIGLSFVGPIPTILTGSLANLIDGDPNTYIRFQFDTNLFTTQIQVQLDNGQYRVDELAVLAPPVGSGVDVAECPNYIVVETAVGENNLGGSNNFLYAFYDFEDVNSNDWINWTLGEEKILKSPKLLTSYDRLGFRIRSIQNQAFPRYMAPIFEGKDVRRISISAPYIFREGSSQTTINPIPGDDTTKVTIEEVDFEIRSHKKVVTIITESVDINDAFLFGQENHATEMFICNGGATDITLNIAVSTSFSVAPRINPLYAKRTVVNASATNTVTLNLASFTTVIDSAPLVIPPKGSVNFMEYAEGSIVVWK